MSLNISLLKIFLANYPLVKKMRAYRSRFAFRIEKTIERLVTVTRQLSANKPEQPRLDLLFISISYLVSPPSSSLLIFFSFFIHLRPNFILFWRITNIGYSSQRLEKLRYAIGSWSIRQDYSDTQNLSETASVFKIGIKINQVILF